MAVIETRFVDAFDMNNFWCIESKSLQSDCAVIRLQPNGGTIHRDPKTVRAPKEAFYELSMDEYSSYVFTDGELLYFAKLRG